MTFGKRLKIALFGSAGAAIAGSLVYLLLSDEFRKLTLFVLIAAAVIFALAFILCLILEGKPGKVRVPVFIVLTVLAVLVTSSVTAYNLAGRTLIEPFFDEDAYEDITDLELNAETISTENLFGWRIPASGVSEDEVRTVILYFADSTEDSSSKVLEILKEENQTFLYEKSDFICFDYPTYGKSSGEFSDDSLEAYAINAFEYVSSLGTTGDIKVLSYSFGTIPAVYLASEKAEGVSELIMLSPFANASELFNGTMNLFHGPFKLLLPIKLDPIDFADEITCPVTIIASADDDVIYIEYSRELFSALTSDIADFITISDVAHDEFFESEEALAALEDSCEV